MNVSITIDHKKEVTTLNIEGVTKQELVDIIRDIQSERPQRKLDPMVLKGLIDSDRSGSVTIPIKPIPFFPNA